MVNKIEKNSLKVVNVVIGLLFNSEKRILIACRPPQVVSPGYWEFPGGKAERNEALEAALAREFMEEVGVEVSQARFLFQFEKSVIDAEIKLHLHVFEITRYSGEPRGCENQEIVFSTIDQLKDYKFLPANEKILGYLNSREG